MDMRRGLLQLPEQQDFQMLGSWIPGTPAKPVLVTRHTAAAEGHGEHTPGANWFQSVVDLPPGFICGGGAVQESACQNGSAGSTGVPDLNICESLVASDSLVSGPNDVSQQMWSMGGSTPGWHRTYSDLVAMAANPFSPIGCGTSLPTLVCGNIRSGSEHSSSPLLLNGRVMIRTELLSGTQSLSAACEAVAPSFAPVTPDKQKGTQDGQHLGISDSVDGREIVRERQEQASVLPKFDPREESIQICFDQGVSEQTYVSTVGLPSQLQGMQAQENADKQGVELNKTPPQKPRRKKHRPKVVREGKPARTPKSATRKPATPNPAKTGESTSGKRKYVRRKGLNSPLETSPSVLEGGTVQLHGRRKRSARRHLDFSDAGGSVTCDGATTMVQAQAVVQAQAESIPEENTNHSTGNGSGCGTKSTNVPHKEEGVDVNSSSGIALSPNSSNNQILDVYLNSLDIPSLPMHPSRRELVRENLKKLARLRDRRQVPNQESNPHSETQTGCQSTPKNLSSVTISNLLPRDESKGRNERNMENSVFTDDARFQKVSMVQAHLNYELTSNHNQMNGVSEYPGQRDSHLPCFPETHKKRRTQKGHNGLAFSGMASFADAQRILEHEKLLAMEGKQAFGQAEVKTGKRLTVPTKIFNLPSFIDNIKNDQLPGAPRMRNEKQENGIIHGPDACVEALAADMCAKVRRKRRTRTGQTQDFNIISATHNSSNFYGAIVPYMMQGDVSVHPIDVIIHKMQCLSIGDQGQNRIQEQCAIVPYGAHGMMVPFHGLLDPTKKSRPRAKVDLDQETNRVWKLLMGKESNEGTEGTDADKEKWWEEERQVFRGRADSFIARMHLVQGDRRFSPWKGSVLDSVIGVFLTQNVSDHLSSSAFMALAARFPHQSRGKNREINSVKANTFVEHAMVCPVDLNVTENSSDQQAHDHVQVVVHECEQMKQKEMHPAGSNIEGDIFTYATIFNAQLRERHLTEAHDREPLDNIHSSQSSAVSSQNSSDDLVLTTDQVVSISESQFEDVDLLTVERCGSECRPSFMKLLEIAGTSNFQGLYAHSNIRNSERGCCDTSFTDILKHGCTIGDESSLFSSITPVEIKSSGTGICPLPESATDIFNREKSALTSQSVSSGHSQAFMVNMPSESLSGSSANTGYSKHSYDNGVHSGIITETPTCNSFHNYSVIQEERTKEIQRKERGTDVYVKNIQIGSEAFSKPSNYIAHQVHSDLVYPKQTPDNVECFTKVDNMEKCVAEKAVKENPKEEVRSSKKEPIGEASSAPRTRRVKGEKERNKIFDWEHLRRQVCQNGANKERSNDTMDSLDWEAVRDADVSEISNTIRERGMNNMLAERIQSFLDRLVNDHGSVDLEWLRDVPPDKAKDYLLSIRGLGLKSVECVRLLTLHHLAFPVDTNVGRICVRLGWVPLQPLPESLQLHLLELYPMLETIQKYLWPRLCTLDQRTLYELHYQMITFGKVFCTKSKPNCNACPMRGECKHFASAFASARLALPGPEEKSLVTATMEQNHRTVINQRPLPQIEGNSLLLEGRVGRSCEPIIEEPATPENECTQIQDIPDIEDAFYEDPDEIPIIKLNTKEFAQNLQNYMQENNMELQNVDWSKALVTLTPEAASIPTPKLKNVSRLRTEHQVYELPDSHPLLEGLDRREPQDPCPYLLAIWTPGETAQSTEPPESCSNAQGTGNLCDRSTCFSCNSIREAQAQTVRGTLLIPCRTAMRGSFPLNGTYFQVNEVFADHESSLTPIDVPRALIWNLPRRTVYFGTSVPTIFKGLAIEDIQNCFWRGFVCVRGFDRTTRGPRPLMARLHFPASKAPRGKKPVAKDGK